MYLYVSYYYFCRTRPPDASLYQGFVWNPPISAEAKLQSHVPCRQLLSPSVFYHFQKKWGRLSLNLMPTESTSAEIHDRVVRNNDGLTAVSDLPKHCWNSLDADYHHRLSASVCNVLLLKIQRLKSYPAKSFLKVFRLWNYAVYMTLWPSALIYVPWQNWRTSLRPWEDQFSIEALD